jgi:hypothetical protein
LETFLVIVALVIAVILLTSGGPVVPHIVGPITFTVIGVFLLLRNTNAAR